jgi:hypothetical protein
MPMFIGAVKDVTVGGQVCDGQASASAEACRCLLGREDDAVAFEPKDSIHSLKTSKPFGRMPGPLGSAKFSKIGPTAPRNQLSLLSYWSPGGPAPVAGLPLDETR